MAPHYLVSFWRRMLNHFLGGRGNQIDLHQCSILPPLHAKGVLLVDVESGELMAGWELAAPYQEGVTGS